MNITQQYEQKAKELFELIDSPEMEEAMKNSKFKFTHTTLILNKSEGNFVSVISEDTMYDMIKSLLNKNEKVAKKVVREFLYTLT